MMNIFKANIDKTYSIDVFVMAKDKESAKEAIQYQLDYRHLSAEDDCLPHTNIFLQEIKIHDKNDNILKIMKEEIKTYGIVMAETNTIESNEKIIDFLIVKTEEEKRKAEKEKWLKENHLEFQFVNEL